jgi:hypothetical protein
MFGLDFYDAVLTTGQNQIDLLKHIETLRPNITKKEFVTVGSPILDSLSLRLSEKNCNKQEQKKKTGLFFLLQVGERKAFFPSSVQILF